jgi:putative FmdB family regulatory protein
LWVIHDKEVLDMPAYDYRCPKCNIQNEITHGWHDRPIIPCTYCNEPMVKVIAPIPAVFKGTGWGKD